MARRFGKILQIAFLVFGFFIFISVIKKAGFENVLDHLRKLNWWFLPVFIISLTWYWLYTFAWQELLKPYSRVLSAFDLFKAKISGEAVNSINPAGFMVGDPVRVYLLKGNFPVKEGGASVVVDRTIHSIAILFVILMGIIVGFPVLDFLPKKAQVGVPAFFLAMTVFLVLIVLFQRKGIFVLPFKLMRRFDIRRDFAAKMIFQMEELDQNIRSFYNMNKKGFLIALIYHFAGRLLGIVEIYIFGIAVSSEFTLRMAILLGALSPVVNATFAFLPGALGVMEGAYSGLLYVMGLNPVAGIAIQIGRRIRAIFWILVGLIFIGLHKRETTEDNTHFDV